MCVALAWSGRLAPAQPHVPAARATASVGAVAFSTTQQGGSFETAAVGGRGGTAFADRCATNEVMAGISAQIANADVTALSITCRTIGGDGALGRSAPPRMRLGGSAPPGLTTRAECPLGQVLRGMAVHFDDAVRGLTLYCRVWGRSGFGPTGGASGTVGVSRGTMVPLTCPPDGAQPAVGIRGTATERVIALRLVCDTPRR